MRPSHWPTEDVSKDTQKQVRKFYGKKRRRGQIARKTAGRSQHNTARRQRRASR